MGHLARIAPKAGAEEVRVGPDPVTVVLPALSALGAIASVAALNWTGHSDGAGRRRTRRGTVQILRDLERDCRDLQDIFKRLARTLPQLASGGGTTSLPMKFGVHGLEVTEESYPLYQSLVSSLGSVLLRASQDSHDLVTSIEDGLIVPPESAFYAFGDAQERLNAILVTRASLKVAIETGYDVAIKLTALIEELHAYQRA